MNHPITKSPNSPSRVWSPDVILPAESAGRLIESQFPTLAPVSLSLLGRGWDNDAYLVNDEFIFRFPRRAVAAPLIENESRVLPLLAPLLPLPIPVPVFVGRAADGYPYPFGGYARIAGLGAYEIALSDPNRAQLARPLARLLRILHRIPIDPSTLAWAPRDDIRRADIPYRAEKVRERLHALPAGICGVDVLSLRAAVDRALAAPPHAGPGVWVHGDLYARHLLLDEGGRLSGVIDWGDSHVGDPALDLSIAFSFLPVSAREVFHDEYGPADEGTRVRARFRAVHYGLLLREYGLDVGDRAITAAGEHALRASSQ